MSAVLDKKPATAENPTDEYLRMDRMPSIWCPGCGIGTTVNCFTRALTECGLDLDKTAIVSGIGCTGRVAGYLNLDSFHDPRSSHPLRHRPEALQPGAQGGGVLG